MRSTPFRESPEFMLTVHFSWLPLQGEISRGWMCLFGAASARLPMRPNDAKSPQHAATNALRERGYSHVLVQMLFSKYTYRSEDAISGEVSIGPFLKCYKTKESRQQKQLLIASKQPRGPIAVGVDPRNPSGEGVCKQNGRMKSNVGIRTELAGDKGLLGCMVNGSRMPGFYGHQVSAMLVRFLSYHLKEPMRSVSTPLGCGDLWIGRNSEVKLNLL